MNLKQRLKAIETLLIPPARKIIFRFFSVVDYDDDTELKAYKCYGVTIERIEGESLEQFQDRAKTSFIEQQGGGKGFFLQPIYTSDNTTGIEP